MTWLSGDVAEEVVIEEGVSFVTPAKLVALYKPEECDPFVDKVLGDAIPMADAYARGMMARMVIGPQTFLDIEMAGIIYGNCLPADHPLRAKYPENEVKACLVMHRNAKFGMGGCPYGTS